MKKIKGIIFDFDGVIVQTENVKVLRIYEKLLLYGVAVKKEDMRFFFGMNSKQLQNEFDLWFMSDRQYKKNRENILKKNPRQMEFRTIMSKNITVLLEQLTASSIQCMIASNSSKKRLFEALEECQLLKYFRYIGSAGEIGHFKPDPAVYYRCMEQGQITEDVCLIIEDSPLGIEAAKKTHCQVIALKNSEFDLDQTQSDYVVDDLLDIINIIKEVEQ